jgi:hypothetical protein
MRTFHPRSFSPSPAVNLPSSIFPFSSLLFIAETQIYDAIRSRHFSSTFRKLTDQFEGYVSGEQMDLMTRGWKLEAEMRGAGARLGSSVDATSTTPLWYYYGTMNVCYTLSLSYELISISVSTMLYCVLLPYFLLNSTAFCTFYNEHTCRNNISYGQ